MHTKLIPSIFMLFVFANIFAQKATEIYLFDIKRIENSYIISNPVNISNREGYDNQPSFTEDGNYVLFTSMRDGQTDIARYDIEKGNRIWITDTPVNEYSPAPYLGKKKYFTCVRSENDKQFLYKYAFKNKEPEVLIPNLNVGYYVWFNKNIIITYVLGDIESIQVSNFKYKIKYPIAQDIGRSLNKIPNLSSAGRDKISFISKSYGNPEIYEIDPLNSESNYLIDPVEGAEDLTWTIDGAILMAKGDVIYKFHPRTDSSWNAILIESEFPIKNITRLAVSPDGKKIAVVAGK